MVDITSSKIKVKFMVVIIQKYKGWFLKKKISLTNRVQFIFLYHFKLDEFHFFVRWSFCILYIFHLLLYASRFISNYMQVKKILWFFFWLRKVSFQFKFHNNRKKRHKYKRMITIETKKEEENNHMKKWKLF